MNKVKYQVFVSSTFDDLKEERDQVIKAVLEMGHIPVGMEMFSAADEEQWQIITRQIDDSDYYIVIVANRYGSMVEGVSYTEKEYDYAVEKGVPTLGFVLDSKAPWPSNRSETDKKAKSKLEAFKKKVKAKPVNFWTSKADLHGMCAIALGKAINTRPRPGWLRSPDAVGPEVASELSRLSSENARLRTELAKLSATDDTSGFAQGEDIVDLNFSIYRGAPTDLTKVKLPKTWNELLMVVAQSILTNPEETEIERSYIKAFKDEIILLSPYETMAREYLARENRNEYLGFKNSTGVLLEITDLLLVKLQFVALNLIEIKHISSDSGLKAVWSLTQKGERLFASMVAQRR